MVMLSSLPAASAAASRASHTASAELPARAISSPSSGSAMAPCRPSLRQHHVAAFQRDRLLDLGLEGLSLADCALNDVAVGVDEGRGLVE